MYASTGRPQSRLSAKSLSALAVCSLNPPEIAWTAPIISALLAIVTTSGRQAEVGDDDAVEHPEQRGAEDRDDDRGREIPLGAVLGGDERAAA